MFLGIPLNSNALLNTAGGFSILVAYCVVIMTPFGAADAVRLPILMALLFLTDCYIIFNQLIFTRVP